jgi:hypothetical protein
MKRVSQIRIQLPKDFPDAVKGAVFHDGDSGSSRIRIYGANENIQALYEIPPCDRFAAVELFCDYTAERVFGADVCRLCQIDPNLIVNETTLDYVEGKVNATYRDVAPQVKRELRGKGIPRSELATRKLSEKAYCITRLMAQFIDPTDVRTRLSNYYENRNHAGVIGSTLEVFSPGVVFRDSKLDCEMFELYRRKESTHLAAHVVVSFKHTPDQMERIRLLCRRFGALFVKEFAPNAGHWIGITRKYTPTPTHSSIRLHLFIAHHNKDGSIITWKPHNVIAMSKFAPCPEIRLGHGHGITSNLPGELPYPKADRLGIRDRAVGDSEMNVESAGQLTRKIQTLMKPEDTVSPGYEEYFGAK